MLTDKKITIEPFTDIYINCFMNGIFSILTSVDKEYQKLTCINDYEYAIVECGDDENKSEKALRVRYQLKSYARAYFHLFQKELPCSTLEEFFHSEIPMGEPYMLKSGDAAIVELKQLLDQGNFIYIATDLYYLVKSNIMYYQKNHLSHYTLLTGYDDKGEQFYVFENGAKGYNRYAVDQQQILDAIKYAKQKIKCYYFHIPQQILIPNICIEDIKKNAESIIASLEQLGREKDLWTFPMGDAAYRINAENASAIMYRHKANRILFQNCIPYIDKDVFIKLTADCDSLIKNWEWMKNMLLKAYFSKNKSIYSMLCLKRQKLFEMEINMWKLLIRGGPGQ